MIIGVIMLSDGGLCTELAGPLRRSSEGALPCLTGGCDTCTDTILVIFPFFSLAGRSSLSWMKKVNTLFFGSKAPFSLLSFLAS